MSPRQRYRQPIEPGHSRYAFSVHLQEADSDKVYICVDEAIAGGSYYPIWQVVIHKGSIGSTVDREVLGAIAEATRKLRVELAVAAAPFA